LREALFFRAAMLLPSANSELPGRLLPQAAPLRSMSTAEFEVRRLLPETDALRAVLASLWIV
jgi:hypothetical protein